MTTTNKSNKRVSQVGKISGLHTSLIGAASNIEKDLVCQERSCILPPFPASCTRIHETQYKHNPETHTQPKTRESTVRTMTMSGSF